MNTQEQHSKEMTSSQTTAQTFRHTPPPIHTSPYQPSDTSHTTPFDLTDREHFQDTTSHTTPTSPIDTQQMQHTIEKLCQTLTSLATTDHNQQESPISKHLKDPVTLPRLDKTNLASISTFNTAMEAAFRVSALTRLVAYTSNRQARQPHQLKLEHALQYIDNTNEDAHYYDVDKLLGDLNDAIKASLDVRDGITKDIHLRYTEHLQAIQNETHEDIKPHQPMRNNALINLISYVAAAHSHIRDSHYEIDNIINYRYNSKSTTYFSEGINNVDTLIEALNNDNRYSNREKGKILYNATIMNDTFPTPNGNTDIYVAPLQPHMAKQDFAAAGRAIIGAMIDFQWFPQTNNKAPINNIQETKPSSQGTTTTTPTPSWATETTCHNCNAIKPCDCVRCVNPTCCYKNNRTAHWGCPESNTFTVQVANGTPLTPDQIRKVKGGSAYCSKLITRTNNSYNAYTNTTTSMQSHQHDNTTAQPTIEVIVDSGAAASVIDSHASSDNVTPSTKQLMTFNGQPTPRGTTATTTLVTTDTNDEPLTIPLTTECIDTSNNEPPTKLLLSTTELLENNTGTNNYYHQTADKATLRLGTKTIDLIKINKLWQFPTLTTTHNNNNDSNTTATHIMNIKASNPKMLHVHVLEQRQEKKIRKQERAAKAQMKTTNRTITTCTPYTEGHDQTTNMDTTSTPDSIQHTHTLDQREIKKIESHIPTEDNNHNMITAGRTQQSVDEPQAERDDYTTSATYQNRPQKPKEEADEKPTKPEKTLLTEPTATTTPTPRTIKDTTVNKAIDFLTTISDKERARQVTKILAKLGRAKPLITAGKRTNALPHFSPYDLTRRANEAFVAEVATKAKHLIDFINDTDRTLSIVHATPINHVADVLQNFTNTYIKQAAFTDAEDKQYPTHIIGKIITNNSKNNTFNHTTKYTAEFTDGSQSKLTAKTILNLWGTNSKPTPGEIAAYENSIRTHRKEDNQENHENNTTSKPEPDQQPTDDGDDNDDDNNQQDPTQASNDRHNDSSNQPTDSSEHQQAQAYLNLSAALGFPSLPLLQKMYKDEAIEGIRKKLPSKPKIHYRSIAELVGKARQQKRGKHTIFKDVNEIGEAISMDTFTAPKENTGMTGITNATIVEDKVSDLVKVFFHSNHSRDSTDLPTMKAILDTVLTHYHNHGKTPKQLRLDQLPAWKGSTIKTNPDDFKSYAASKGIEATTSSTRSSHQNLSENSMRTLFQVVTAFYINAKHHLGNELIQPSIWPVLMSYAAEVINARPKQGENESPHKKFYGFDHHISHYHPPLCPAAILHPKTGNNNNIANDDINHKFTDKATMGLFAGYPQNSSGYRIWIPSPDGKGGTFKISEHVVFDDSFATAKFFTDTFANGSNTNITTTDLNTQWLKDCDCTIQDSFTSLHSSLQTSTHSALDDNIYNQQQPINNIQFIDHTKLHVEHDETAKQTTDFFETLDNMGIRPADAEHIGDEDEELPYHTDPNNKPMSFLQMSDQQYHAYINNIKLKPIEDLNESTYTTPRHRQQALSDEHSRHYIEAMDHEVDCISQFIKYITVEEKDKLMKQHNIPKLVRLQWTYKAKFEDGHHSKMRARLVQRGDLLKQYYTDEEKYSPTLRAQTTKILLIEALHKRMIIKQYDVPLAYLNAEPGRITICHGIEGYKKYDSQGREMFALLTRNLYGGVDSGKPWYDHNTNFITNDLQLTQCPEDPCLFYNEDRSVFIACYVDDLIIATSDQHLQDQYYRLFYEKYKIKDEGELHWYLGVKYERTEKGLFTSQTAHINKLIDFCELQDAHPALKPYSTNRTIIPDNTYTSLIEHQEKQEWLQKVVGQLTYLSCCTRPDIATATNIIARYTTKPSPTVIQAAKHIVRYLKGTKHLGTLLQPHNDQRLTCYVDASFMQDWKIHGYSRYGYIMFINNTPIAWKSSYLRCNVQSTTEAEYCALSQCARAAIPLQRLQNLIANRDIDDAIPMQIDFKEDNQSTIKTVLREEIANLRCKHISSYYHFIRDLHKSGIANIQYIHTSEQLADFLTKTTISHDDFRKIRQIIMTTPPNYEG
jgi:hypothetical protein